MIAEKKLLHIVERLLAKAKADEIHWQQDPALSEDDGSHSFTVEFKESTFYIQYRSPPTEPDEIEIGVENKQGDPLKRLSIRDEDDPRWSLVLGSIRRQNVRARHRSSE